MKAAVAPGPRVRPVWNSMFDPAACRKVLPADDGDPLAFHRTLAGYRPTPLVELPGLAKDLGVGRLLVKDESKRFGLNAFKCLGASYAMYRFIAKAWKARFQEELPPEQFFKVDVPGKLGRITFTTATDGNHGRAVAWTARQLHQAAVIYIPEGSVPARIEALRGEGAEVVVFPGNYDATVEACTRDAAAHKRQVISDTAWDGYTEIPLWITAGYRSIFREVDAQLPAVPDLVFLQAGVGGLASAGTWHYLAKKGKKLPGLACVEPLSADCLTESVAHGDGERHTALGRQDSIMAGLNCGVPSLIAWPIVKTGMEYFLAVHDDFARDAMAALYHPRGRDPRVVSGESGAAGLAALLALARDRDLAEDRKRLGLGPEATVLLVSTEGDTDPENFRKVVEAGRP